MAPEDRDEVYPFHLAKDQLESQMDRMVDVTVSSLSSFYLELPRAESFLEYDDFETAYEQLRSETMDFESLDRDCIRDLVRENSLVLVVLRCILGMTPPDLADMASDDSGLDIDQTYARGLDQRARQGQPVYNGVQANNQKIDALIEAACSAIESGPGTPSPKLIHRLMKIDTMHGLESVRKAATEKVDYSALLYERMLGRPFATYRDSVSRMVGEIVEMAVIAELALARIPYYQTKPRDVIAGFDQAPDFLIPDRINPKIVIEAKLSQDDGTARDKVTRVQHLSQLSKNGMGFELIACIDGRGFKIRRQDMRKLLRATDGKVFSIATMSHLVEQTGLRDFRNRL